MTTAEDYQAYLEWICEAFKEEALEIRRRVKAQRKEEGKADPGDEGELSAYYKVISTMINRGETRDIHIKAFSGIYPERDIL